MTRLIAFAALVPALASGCGRSAPGDRVVPLGEPVARLGDSRLRHVGSISRLMFRPDGTALAGFTHSTPVVVEWDVKTGREVRRYADDDRPAGGVWPVGYALGGRRLVVVVGRDRAVAHDRDRAVVYNTATGRVAGRYEVAGVVTASPDGRTLAGPTADRRLTVWDLETGKPLHTLAADAVGRPEFSPDGRLIACLTEQPPEGNRPRRYTVWVGPADGSGPGRRLLPPADDAFPLVAWARTDRLVVRCEGRLTAFDPTTGERVAAVDHTPDRLYDVFRGADGRFYVQGYRNRPAVEYDPDTLKQVPGGLTHPTRDEAPVLSPDGATRAVADGVAVRLLDAKTGASRHPELDRQPSGPWWTFQFSTDGRRVLGLAHRTARIWDVADGRPADAAGRDVPHAYDLALSPDGRWLAGTAGEDQAYRLIIRDAGTGAEVFRQDAAAGPDRPFQAVIGFDPAGRAWTRGRAGIVCYEVPSGRVVRSIRPPDGWAGVVLSPDGRKLAVTGETVAVRDATEAGEWKLLEKYRPFRPDTRDARPPYPTLIGLTPDGGRLLTRRGIWDVAGKPVKVRDEGVPAYAVAFSPDGRRMAFHHHTGDGPHPGTDGRRDELLVWDVATLSELGRVPLPAGVTAVGFDPAGRLWLSHADTTLTVHPWDWAAFDPR